jgi:hypothetical protein
MLAQTLGLDMTATWTSTVASYFRRVSKDRIIEAVREGVSVEAAGNIAGMKKQAMAEGAHRVPDPEKIDIDGLRMSEHPALFEREIGPAVLSMASA